MVYQSIVCCAAFLSLYSMLDRISQKFAPKMAYIHAVPGRSEKNPYRWIQITNEQEKNSVCTNACNQIIKEGSCLSPDGKKLIKLTRHDLTHTASYYHLSLREITTHDFLLQEEFEHEQNPILFFTPDNKAVIKLGTIINIWDIPKKSLNSKETI